MYYVEVDENFRIVALIETSQMEEKLFQISEKDFLFLQKEGLLEYGYLKFKIDEGKIKKIDYSKDVRYQEEMKINKLKKLRDIRNSKLNETDWITIKILEEEKRCGECKSYSSEKLKELFEYRQYLRDLPQIIDIDKYNLDDIEIENVEIFRQNPLKLTEQVLDVVY